MSNTDAIGKLKSLGQSNVLRFVDQLDSASKKKLLEQLASQDLNALAALSDEYVKNKPVVALPKDIQPVQAYPRVPDAARRGLYQDAEKLGRELLSHGKVAAFLVAGGQGTRLGYDGPKGEYPVTPIKNKPLFQVFAEQLLNHGKTFGKPVPWYIMTSDINDAPTRAFFEHNKHFGLNPADVFFFQQGMMPAFSMDGQLLLAEKDSLALSPDGHGGSLRALYKSGAIADMRKRGIEHLSYFQVDNPLVQVIDPLFIGLHAITGSEMSTKTIPKASALEKVGNLVVGDGSRPSDRIQRPAGITRRANQPRWHVAIQQWFDRHPCPHRSICRKSQYQRPSQTSLASGRKEGRLRRCIRQADQARQAQRGQARTVCVRCHSPGKKCDGLHH